MAQPPENPIVDIHTHMYPPSYIKILESRDTIPLIRHFPNSPDPRLILLEAEVELLKQATDASEPPSKLPGRPLTSHFTSLPQKLQFMKSHGISTSVISLANPWLDFLPADTAGPLGQSINAEFDDMCEQHPYQLYFFATLPLTASLDTISSAVHHAKALKHCRGVILGTSGQGKGLDDPAMLPIFKLLADAELTVFLHPHYGLPNEVWGPRAAEYGHVLPLAIGFPVETTIAVTRMLLAGVFDQLPGLRMLLAHSGGALPFLAGRIESCIRHDGQLVRDGKVGEGRRTIWEVLKEQVYLDAVIYSEVGLKAAVEAAGGADRLMFGTDHPFFPPVGEVGAEGEEKWESVGLNVEAIHRALGAGSQESRGVAGGNAVRVLRLWEDKS